MLRTRLVVGTMCCLQVMIGVVSAEDNCRVINAWNEDAAFMEDAKEVILESFGADPDGWSLAWLKQVKACKMGQYTVWVPADGESSEMWVLRGDELFVSIEPSTVSVLEDGSRVVVQIAKRDGNPSYNSISYSSPTDASGIWRDASDFGMDGTLDQRTAFGPGEVIKSELWRNGEWHDVGKLAEMDDPEPVQDPKVEDGKPRK